MSTPSVLFPPTRNLPSHKYERRIQCVFLQIFQCPCLFIAIAKFFHQESRFRLRFLCPALQSYNVPGIPVGPSESHSVSQPPRDPKLPWCSWAQPWNDLVLCSILGIKPMWKKGVVAMHRVSTRSAFRVIKSRPALRNLHARIPRAITRAITRLRLLNPRSKF